MSTWLSYICLFQGISICYNVSDHVLLLIKYTEEQRWFSQTWLLLLYGCQSHQFLIKDTSGSQGPESGYCSISNLSLQPDNHPGLSCCQEERPKRGGKYTDSPKEAGQMPK